MNPGELRKYAKRYEWADGDISEWLFAAADAWEETERKKSMVDMLLDDAMEEVVRLRKRVFDYGELITEHQGVIATLRKRLEAAEIERAEAKWLLMTSPNNGGRAWCIRRDAWLAKQLAALAGEEKP